jgi:Flp pilus assembly protein TadG
MIVHARRRSGATLVECAFIYPIAFLLLLGLVVGGLGIFRYQEVAHLAREGARYASTHGGKYQEEGMPQQTGVSAISSSSDLSTYLATQTTLLDPSKLQVSVSWSAAGSITPANYPSYADSTSTVPGQSIIQNYVTVTVTYQWLPEVFLVGPITLTSTSQMAMSY